MKVQELRQLSGASERSFLEKALVESYKQLPKSRKEEFDPSLRLILAGEDTSGEKKKAVVDFADLKREIPIFIDNACEQNYFAPNRVIPKSQRPKWRFLVKGYIKELEKIPLEDENYAESAKLLKDLYLLICKACHYYLFSTDDPFRSIGWEQSEFFHLVVKRVLGTGYTRENISELLLLAATGGLSRVSLHVYQQTVLLSELKTSDVKYMAVEEAMKLVEGREKKLVKLGKYDNQRYELTEGINNLCGMILQIQIALAEPEVGVQYFFKKCVERDKEIILYRALDLIEWMEDDELWLQVYEYGLKKKIKPRESLMIEYDRRRMEEQTDASGADDKPL